MSVNLEEAVLVKGGKIFTGRAGQTKASSITFDPTGTDLVSTTAESAIKEVNAKTKHGIVELWANSNINSNFAGQTITINDYDSTKYDAIVLVMEMRTGEGYASIWMQLDNTTFTGTNKTLHNLTVGSEGPYLFMRSVAPSLSGTTLSLVFGDNTLSVYPWSGATPSTSTRNDWNIPVRILGLIHNS